MTIEVYVVPTITDDKILPTSSIPSSYLSNQISLAGCPGEFVPATFVIKAVDGDIPSLLPTPSNVGAIPTSAVDMYAIKCWWQAGYGTGDITHKHLTPELLLKDDSLVKVEAGENYLKMLDGSYLWISDPTPTTTPYKRWSIDEISVKDSETLQPVNIPTGTNKQFWITFKIPDSTPPGIYTGTIELRTPTEVLGSIDLSMEVLPIELLESYLEYGIYYTARLSNSYPQGAICSQTKSEQQLRAELQDLYDHGIKSPTVYQGVYQETIDMALVGRFLAIRNEVGLGNQPLYLILQGPRETQDPDIVPQYLAIAQSYGVSEVYFYGIDECLGHRLTIPDTDPPITEAPEVTVQRLADERPAWEQVRALGGKMFTAGVRVGHYSDARRVGEFGVVGDILDLIVCYGAPSQEEAARWRGVGHRILSYANPVVGEQNPEKYRRNYGLSLWKGNYHGTMPWAYDYAWGNPWNDFDYRLRGQMFGYPTIDGVVDNMSFEGWREGVTDTRYLTTLLNAIEVAKSQGHSTTEAENYLATLKEADLSSIDLSQVRRDMVSHILYLQGVPEPPPPFPPLPTLPPIPAVVWSVLPFFPWEGPPFPRFTQWNWTNLPTPT